MQDRAGRAEAREHRAAGSGQLDAEPDALHDPVSEQLQLELSDVQRVSEHGRRVLQM
jgi:hypothetical protein